MKARSESFVRLVPSIPALVMVCILTGCGAGKTIVMNPVENSIHARTVTLQEDPATVDVPGAVREALQEELSKFVYAKDGFERGSDLVIRYRFIQFTAGSQFNRWFWGGIGNAGEGSMTVEAKFFDASGKQLGVIQSEGKISSGVFGGSIVSAAGHAAEEISKFAKLHFR